MVFGLQVCNGAKYQKINKNPMLRNFLPVDYAPYYDCKILIGQIARPQMKKTLIGLSVLVMSATAFATPTARMEGQGKDVSRCVISAISKAIYHNLKETSPTLTSSAIATQPFRATEIVMSFGEDLVTSEGTVGISNKKLNYLLSEEEIIKGQAIERSSSSNHAGDKVNSTLHRKAIVFSVMTEANGKAKYKTGAQISELRRDYDNNGKIVHVTCTLAKARVLSVSTNAVLLKSE